MIIKAILIIAIFFIGLSFLGGRKSAQIKAGKKLLVITFTVFAVITVLFPEIVNDVAGLIGVGRGTDLLLYSLVVSFIAATLNQYLKDKDEEQRLNKLARNIAILQANLDEHNLNKLK